MSQRDQDGRSVPPTLSAGPTANFHSVALQNGGMLHLLQLWVRQGIQRKQYTAISLSAPCNIPVVVQLGA